MSWSESVAKDTWENNELFEFSLVGDDSMMAILCNEFEPYNVVTNKQLSKGDLFYDGAGQAAVIISQIITGPYKVYEYEAVSEENPTYAVYEDPIVRARNLRFLKTSNTFIDLLEVSGYTGHVVDGDVEIHFKGSDHYCVLARELFEPQYLEFIELWHGVKIESN